MINIVADLVLLKNITRPAFRDCKWYFVYMEITGKSLTGTIVHRQLYIWHKTITVLST